MWSLHTTLEALGKGGHLPFGFQAAKGIRSLFPRVQRSGVSISLLKKYLYSRTGQAGTGSINAQFYVGADGAGHWALAGNITSGGDCRWGAGFVFQFSDSNSGHGFVATGQYDAAVEGELPSPSVLNFSVTGLDPWIGGNWPDVFAKSVFFYVSNATGFDSLPDLANVAKNHGFASLATLQGATSVSTYYQREGSRGGSGSGPSGPGGVDWDIPPTDDGDGDDGG